MMHLRLDNQLPGIHFFPNPLSHYVYAAFIFQECP